MYHCCREKVISITHSECFYVVLVIQHKKHMRVIVLSSTPCPSQPYGYTLRHLNHDLGKEVTDHKKGLDFLYKIVWKIFNSKKNSAKYH
jgi:hypothetical protein